MKHALLVVALAVLTVVANAQEAALVNPNTATEAEITAVPGVTPELAKNIVAGRPYASIKDLDARLKALPAKQRTEIYGRLFVPINLNTATDAEILMIPGLGNRMLHEFKEYRPYKSMEQFRREIGKYVSKTEVARLERYVTLK
jgi:DNA uptake protein ComE-like DNA-binding protein